MHKLSNIALIMRHSVLRILTMVLMLALAACEPDPTSITMTRTIDIYESQGIPLRSPITGFRYATEDGLIPVVLTEATWTAERRRLPAAGPETPPCNDGEAHTLSATSGSRNFLMAAEVIGDTGSDDISDDTDCGCDTHIKRLAFTSLQVEPADEHLQFANLELGKRELCPNLGQDVHSGGREFGGAVDLELSTTLRVADGRLLLDVTYAVTSAP